MWIFEDKPNPTKVVYGKSTSQQMVACFLRKTRHVATVSATLLGQFCVGHYNFFGEIHNNNASPHTSAQISTFLTAQNVELIGQPPHSPLALFISAHQENITWSTIFVKHQFLFY